MKRVLYLLLVLLALSSCGKVDFSSVELEHPYVGHYKGTDCAVVFEQAEEGAVKGRVYLDQGDKLAQHIDFTSDLMKNGKGSLWIKGDEKRLEKVTLKEDKLLGEAGGKAFILSLSPQTELTFLPDYKEPLFDFFTHEVIYAKHVKGYWSSYDPSIELEDDGDYAKVFGLMAPKLLNGGDDLDLNMDLYRPVTDSTHGPLPLLVLIHGGAFYCGDKQDTGFPEMGRHFAERGYVVASINYRLGFWPWSQSVDRAGYQAVQDANAAVRFLLDKQNDYNIDPNNIYVAGSSAGAITALNLAFMDEAHRPDASRGLVGENFKKSLFDTLEWAEKWKQRLLSWTEEGLDWIINKLNRLLDGLDLFNMRIPERNGRVIRYLISLDMTKLPQVLGIDYDLGKINSINPQTDIPFKVKGVVNMWGAVHDVEMLGTSKQTAVLSFHGTADHVVPYDYDYPFEGVLDDYSEGILEAVSLNSETIREFIVTMMPESEKLNQLAFRKMYGSARIDGYSRLEQMRRSELHTVEGGGHSLHRDGDSLSPYFFDTIVPVMTRFLYEEVVDGKAVSLEQKGASFEVTNDDNVAELHWQVEGGAIIGHLDKNKKSVIFFDDATQHSVSVGGRYNNGVEYRETIKIE